MRIFVVLFVLGRWPLHPPIPLLGSWRKAFLSFLRHKTPQREPHTGLRFFPRYRPALRLRPGGRSQAIFAQKKCIARLDRSENGRFHSPFKGS